MKKGLALLCAALLCAAALTACGSGEPGLSSAGKEESAPAAPAASIPPADTAAVAGSVYSTGVFSVLCPAGWKLFPAEDLFGVYADGVDPTGVHLCKGAESERDLKRLPGMMIRFYGEGASFSAPNPGFYTELIEIAPSRIGRYDWNGFSGKNLGKLIIVLWTDDGKTRFQVSIWAEMDEGDILALDDPDVRAILESIFAD